MHDLSRLEKIELVAILMLMALGLAVHIAQTMF
jgi:hypothetical protein